jgi:RNA polymerase sigma-70 factor (ECF subfamily)
MSHADAFAEQRPLLFSIAYRMLGSAADAEDMVQDAFLRWQSAATDDVGSPRAYLSAVVTRLCLDRLKSPAARHDAVEQGARLPAATADDPFAAQAMADSLTAAFVVLLETLRPVERAVFLLHEVFDFDHAAIAAMLGKSEAASRQLLRRARARVAARRPRFSSARREAEQATREFFTALRDADLGGLMGLLADDVTFTADAGGRYGRTRAVTRPLRGATAVARFLVAGRLQAPPEIRHTIGDLHGRPAIFAHDAGELRTVLVLAVAAGRVRAIHVLSDAATLATLANRRPILTS